jgi:hypothetical protein
LKQGELNRASHHLLLILLSAIRCELSAEAKIYKKQGEK